MGRNLISNPLLSSPAIYITTYICDFKCFCFYDYCKLPEFYIINIFCTYGKINK